MWTKEQYNEASKKSYRKNLERSRKRNRERMARYRAANPEFRERQLACKRKWYQENKEQYKSDVEIWRKKNPQRLTAYGRKSKYGITQEQFDIKFESQDRCCAICKSNNTGWKFGWHVDHDHSCCDSEYSCGKCIRGILCQGCNHLLSRSKENIETLKQAIEYIQNYKRDYNAA